MDGESISIKVEVWGSADIVTAAQGDNAGLVVEDHDIARPAPSYTPSDDVEAFCKAVFQAPDLRKRDSVVRSRMAPARPETAPELSVEEFFGEGTKRASDPHKIRLTRRLIGNNEILVEGWSASGECCYTKCIAAGEDVPEGEQPLAKSEIMSQMLKTLNQVRNRLSAEDVELCQKAIRSLDVSGFLELVRRAEITA